MNNEIVQQELEIEQIEQRWKSDVTLSGSSLLLSFLLLGGVFFTPELDRTSKTLGILGTIFSSTIGVVTAVLGDKNERLRKVVQESALRSISNSLAVDQKVDGTVAEIGGLQRLAELVDAVPEHQQQRLIHQFGLQGLTTPTTQELLSHNSSSSTGVIQVAKQLPMFKPDLMAAIDTSWMNQNFWFSSGIVTGEEGSGKTQFLAMMALNIINICPDVDIRIHNPHYDWEEDPWFPGMPREIEESLFLTSPEDCYADMVSVRAELKRRIKDKDRQSRPIVRICDEFQSVMDSIGKDRSLEYVSHAQFIKNEGRKYAKKVNEQDTGIRVIFGTHSLKKGMTGIDSSFLNKLVVMLGNSYTDSSAILPSDFNIKALASEMAILKAELTSSGLMNSQNRTKDRVRPAIVRVPDGTPTVVPIPKPELSQLRYKDYNPQTCKNTPSAETSTSLNASVADWLNELFVWAHGFDIMPNQQALKAKIIELCGRELPSEHMDLITERLKSFYENL